MSHGLTLLTMCTRPGCGDFGSAVDDNGKRVCARHATDDLREGTSVTTPTIPTALTEAQRQRIVAAQAFVHAISCPRATVTEPGCPACPGGTALYLALTHLDEHPRDARGARRIMHDRVCRSEHCGPESDHADRTQSTRVAALRKFRTAEAAEAAS